VEEFQGYAFAYEIDLGSGNMRSSLKLRSGDRLFSRFVTLRRPTHLSVGRRRGVCPLKPLCSPPISPLKPPCGQRQQLFINLLNQLGRRLQLQVSLLFFSLESCDRSSPISDTKKGRGNSGDTGGPGIPGTLSAGR